MKVLFDTNVALDIFLNRKPFIEDSEQVWKANDEGKITGYISASIITDIYYIVRKRTGPINAHKAVRACLDAFEICVIDRRTLETAASLAVSDFEDGLQAACITTYSLDAIVTRDKQGFKNANVLALSPAELLPTLPT